jgi:hypothetical protein
VSEAAMTSFVLAKNWNSPDGLNQYDFEESQSFELKFLGNSA